MIIWVLTHIFNPGIDGHAIGNSIRVNTDSIHSDATEHTSVTAGFTDAKPMMVFLMIGNNAYQKRAR